MLMISSKLKPEFMLKYNHENQIHKIGVKYYQIKIHTLGKLVRYHNRHQLKVNKYKLKIIFITMNENLSKNKKM